MVISHQISPRDFLIMVRSRAVPQSALINTLAQGGGAKAPFQGPREFSAVPSPRAPRPLLLYSFLDKFRGLQKRTLIGALSMSAKCQKQTFHFRAACI